MSSSLQAILDDQDANLAWLFGAVVCLLDALRVQLFIAVSLARGPISCQF